MKLKKGKYENWREITEKMLCGLSSEILDSPQKFSNSYGIRIEIITEASYSHSTPTDCYNSDEFATCFFCFILSFKISRNFSVDAVTFYQKGGVDNYNIYPLIFMNRSPHMHNRRNTSLITEAMSFFFFSWSGKVFRMGKMPHV